MMNAVVLPPNSSRILTIALVTSCSSKQPCLLRKMSSSAHTSSVSMMKVGQTLTGAKGSYQLTHPVDKGIHSSAAFKAKVLSRNGGHVPAKWVLIKTALPHNKDAWKSLKREYDAYRRPSIISSTSIRDMYDIVGHPKDLDAGSNPPYLVLEWLECTLEDVPSELHRKNYILLEAITNACLSGLATLRENNLIHTDHPTVKIGDLGLVRTDGFMGPAQPFAMRAPEVYQGLGCVHASDVWAFAVTLFDWIKNGVFGTKGNQIPIYNESWSIAKLMRLFPGWVGPPDNDEVRQCEFDFARNLVEAPDPDNPDEKLLKVSTLDNEMQTMDIPRELKDLFLYMFVPDPTKRPTAAEALASDEFQALKRRALTNRKVMK